MDVVVVSLQHLEPARQPFIGHPEDRKIMQILDLVVNIELVEHELEPRHELPRKFLRRKLAGAKLRGDLLNRDGQLTKHGVAREPETRHPTEVWMGLPLLARVTGNQDA